MHTVDVVIPVHGKWELTEACLEAVSRQTRDAHVIVVDDASTDETPDRLSELAGIDVVTLPTNRGFAAACNAGIRAGAGDVVVLLNNDVVAEPQMLAELVAVFDDAKVGSATALLLRPDGMVDAFGICADLTAAGYVRFHGAPITEIHHESTKLLGPYGAVAAYRRDALTAVGLFDEGIGMYGEELDLALRLASAGWHTRAVAAARGVHLGGGTAGAGSRGQRRRAGFGRGYLVRAWKVLHTRHALRALATEAAVVIADAVASRDLVALTSRVAGWRAARAAEPRPPLPSAVDRRIGFIRSLRLRASSRWPGESS